MTFSPTPSGTGMKRIRPMPRNSSGFVLSELAAPPDEGQSDKQKSQSTLQSRWP